MTTDDLTRLRERAAVDPDIATLLALLNGKAGKPKAIIDPSFVVRYRAGETLTALAPEAGVSIATMRKFLHSHGVVMRRAGRAKKQIDPALLEQYANGTIESIMALAAAARVSTSKGKRALAEAGIKKPIGKPLNPRTGEMMEMRRQGQTLVEIGQQFGVTKERVRQLTFGVVVERTGHTIMELADAWGCSYHFLHRQAKELFGPLREGHGRIITPAAAEQLRAFITKYCVICGIEIGVRCNKLCGKHDCLSKHTLRQRATTLERNPDTRVQQVAAALRAVDPGDEFLRLSEAAEVSGCSVQRLGYLRVVQAIATRPSGRKVFGTRDEQLYSKAHCLALREVEGKS